MAPMTPEADFSGGTWDLLVETGYLNVANEFVVEQSDIIQSRWRDPAHAATVWRDGGLFGRADTAPFGNGYQTTTSLNKPRGGLKRINPKSTLRQVTFVLRTA
jgi:hypothetical protein